MLKNGKSQVDFAGSIDIIEVKQVIIITCPNISLQIKYIIISVTFYVYDFILDFYVFCNQVRVEEETPFQQVIVL